MRHLPTEVGLLVAAHRSTVEKVVRWPETRSRSIEFLTVPPEIDFTPWCQDPFLGASAGPSGVLTFLLPKSPLRRADRQVAEILANHLGAEVMQTPARFEGGNVLVTDNHILVGRDTIGGNGDISLSVFLETMGEARPIHIVGTPSNKRHHVGISGTCSDIRVEERRGFAGSSQPIFHLDAFISPAGTAPDGRQRILVGDPRSAVALVGRQPLISAEDDLSDELDEIAWTLERQCGFQVIRNPLPVIAVDDTGYDCWTRRSVRERFAGVDGLEDVMAAIEASGLERIPVRRWCLATQNSAIVFDHVRTGPTAVLPSYAQGRFQFLQPSEQRNAYIWSQLGYRVSEIPEFSGYLTTNGSAHCLYKSLPRALTA